MRSTGSPFFCVPARRTRTRICLFVPAAAAHSPTFRADWPRAFFSGRIWTRSDWCLVSQCSRRLRPHFVKQRVYPAFQAAQLEKYQHAQRNPLQCGCKLQNLNDHFLLLPLLPILLCSMGSGRHGRYHPSARPCGLRFSPSSPIASLIASTSLFSSLSWSIFTSIVTPSCSTHTPSVRFVNPAGAKFLACSSSGVCLHCGIAAFLASLSVAKEQDIPLFRPRYAGRQKNDWLPDLRRNLRLKLFPIAVTQCDCGFQQNHFLFFLHVFWRTAERELLAVPIKLGLRPPNPSDFHAALRAVLWADDWFF